MKHFWIFTRQSVAKVTDISNNKFLLHLKEAKYRFISREEHLHQLRHKLLQKNARILSRSLINTVHCNKHHFLYFYNNIKDKNTVMMYAEQETSMSTLKTYSAQIIDYIKKQLLEGKLQPGDKINEVHLAADLNISRAPIREALQMLVNDGLVVYIPQRGKFIKSLSPSEIRDSYFIGGVLEAVAVAESIQHFCQNDMENLAGILTKMEQLRGAENYVTEFTKLDAEFHNTILAYSNRPSIVEYSRNMCQQLSKFLLFRHWPICFSPIEAADRHRRILDALRTGDKHNVEMALREHYISLGDRMAALGHETPPYV